MDKNSLIQDIKNDLNSIKKQVEVTLAKLAVLESMIELDKQLGVSVAEPVEAPDEELGISVQTSGEPSLLELSRVQPEITSGASNEELGIKESAQECRDNACIVSESEPEQEPEQEQEPEIELEKELEKGITPNSSLLTPISEAPAELRNLMSVIGLNDRFRFRHDLFSDSNDLFKETIEILNAIENFDKAVDYLQEKFNWDEEDATVVYFYDIIKPKF